jgi:hypothetical protein
MRGMRRWIACPLLAGVAVLVLSSASGAVIVPQRGMAGVRLGMTEAQVRTLKGRPDAVTHPRSDIIGRFTRLRYGQVLVSIEPGATGKVFSVGTRGRTERTAAGVGVGSTEPFLRAHLHGSRCRTEFGTRHCFIGAFKPGKTVTDFFISRQSHRVTRVEVGYVID